MLYRFKGGRDGDGPVGDLVELGGIVYGRTTAGGNTDGEGSSYGTVISITPQGAY